MKEHDPVTVQVIQNKVRTLFYGFPITMKPIIDFFKNAKFESDLSEVQGVGTDEQST